MMPSVIGQVDVEEVSLGLKAAHGGLFPYIEGMWEEGTRPSSSQSINSSDERESIKKCSKSFASEATCLYDWQAEKEGFRV